MRSMVLAAWLAVPAFWAGCGADDQKNPQDELAGWYDVQEQFDHDTGTQCPAPQVEITENSVDVRVDGNQIELRFSQRWGTLKGELREDDSFLANGSLPPDQSLRITGHFEPPALISSLDEVRGASCTRTFQISGTMHSSQ